MHSPLLPFDGFISWIKGSSGLFRKSRKEKNYPRSLLLPSPHPHFLSISSPSLPLFLTGCCVIENTLTIYQSLLSQLSCLGLGLGLHAERRRGGGGAGWLGGLAWGKLL